MAGPASEASRPASRGRTGAGRSRVLRAVTNALLRDLNTALVADEMRRGTKVIYVDYVDYDEIAHHAGMFRPESLAALDGVDRVLGALGAARASRRRGPYHLVVALRPRAVAGDALRRPLRQRPRRRLCSADRRSRSQSVDEPVEGWGRAEATRRRRRRRQRLEPGERAARAPAPGVAAPTRRRPRSAAGEDLVVLGSGNLGLVYVPGTGTADAGGASTAAGRALVPGLVAHPGIGFVAVPRRDRARPLVGRGRGRPTARHRRGRRGRPAGAVRRRTRPGCCDAVSDAARRPTSTSTARVDPDTLDVAAFEGLVGRPRRARRLAGPAPCCSPRRPGDVVRRRAIEGADELHRLLVSMLERCGQRTEPPRPGPRRRTGRVLAPTCRALSANRTGRRTVSRGRSFGPGGPAPGRGLRAGRGSRRTGRRA